jgi:hypothetical protein
VTSTVKAFFGLHPGVPSGRKYGIEVELENWEGSPSPGMWRAAEDHSLRAGGIEFISPPLTVKDGLAQIDLLYTYKDRFDLESSVRTGIHVHANCSDLSINKVRAVLTVYALVEPLLFHFCGGQREDCIYCVPLSLCDDAPGSMLSFLRSQNKNRTPNLSKYLALNILPLSSLGTIEFRHAPVFEKSSQLKQWLHIVDRVVSFSIGYASPSKVFDAFSSYGITPFLHGIFGDSLGINAKEAAALVREADSFATASLLSPYTYKTNDGWLSIDLIKQGAK